MYQMNCLGPSTRSQYPTNQSLRTASYQEGGSRKTSRLAWDQLSSCTSEAIGNKGHPGRNVRSQRLMADSDVADRDDGGEWTQGGSGGQDRI